MLRAGVVGHPIAHTLSPPIHEAALRHLGVDGSFEVFDVESPDFERFVSEQRSAGLRGLSVTVPHKVTAFELATDRSPEAEATGAVNALVLTGGLAGHNTDVAGFRMALAELGFDPSAKRALVLGAGGAARAVVWALGQAGAEVTAANRTPANAQRLGVPTIALDDVPGALAAVDLLVNATSVGLGDETSPVADAALAQAADGSLRAVLDVVYRPQETALVRSARQVGLLAADGLSMLVFQAAEAFRLFFDLEPPVSVMFEAAEGAARRSTDRPERTS
jgi:shikimate dehydrogenase